MDFTEQRIARNSLDYAAMVTSMIKLARQHLTRDRFILAVSHLERSQGQSTG